MKLLLVTTMLFVSYAYANTPTSTEESVKTEPKNEIEKKASNTKNFHSIKKWRMTIEYNNGDVISKTIVVKGNSKLSALDTAFMEAEKHIKNLGNVKGYSVSPVSNNSFVLLAGN